MAQDNELETLLINTPSTSTPLSEVLISTSEAEEKGKMSTLEVSSFIVSSFSSFVLIL